MYADLRAFRCLIIMTGTEFMVSLDAHLAYYIQQKLNQDQAWQGTCAARAACMFARCPSCLLRARTYNALPNPGVRARVLSRVALRYQCVARYSPYPRC